MATRFDSIPHRRALIDRRGLADALAALDKGDATQRRNAATALLKPALEAGVPDMLAPVA